MMRLSGSDSIFVVIFVLGSYSQTQPDIFVASVSILKYSAIELSIVFSGSRICGSRD